MKEKKTVNVMKIEIIYYTCYRLLYFQLGIAYLTLHHFRVVHLFNYILSTEQIEYSTREVNIFKQERFL